MVDVALGGVKPVACVSCPSVVHRAVVVDTATDQTLVNVWEDSVPFANRVVSDRM